MKYIECPDLTEKKFVSIFVNINKKNFRFAFRWNSYCDCCFLNIYDENGQPVNTGNALVAKRRIRGDKRILPFFYFTHKNNLLYNPRPETLKDYILLYEDTAE